MSTAVVTMSAICQSLRGQVPQSLGQTLQSSPSSNSHFWSPHTKCKNIKHLSSKGYEQCTRTCFRPCKFRTSIREEKSMKNQVPQFCLLINKPKCCKRDILRTFQAKLSSTLFRIADALCAWWQRLSCVF